MRVRSIETGTAARRSARRGFSLIELLVVIAIIAIIAGFIFPLASGMKERGNQTGCIGNLQSIGQALKLYRLDERDYPPALYGYLVEGDTEPTTFLFPHYAKSPGEFKCPDNPNRFNENLFSRAFSGVPSVGGGGAQAQSSQPGKRVPKAGGGYDLDTASGKPVAYYLFDSYDGGMVPPRSTSAASYELHYRRDWASLFGDTNNQDRELLDRNPEDSTFVTTCPYHRQFDGAGNVRRGANSLDIVLFLDGHTEKWPSDQLATAGWKVAPGSPLVTK